MAGLYTLYKNDERGMQIKPIACMGYVYTSQDGR